MPLLTFYELGNALRQDHLADWIKYHHSVPDTDNIASRKDVLEATKHCEAVTDLLGVEKEVVTIPLLDSTNNVMIRVMVVSGLKIAETFHTANVDIRKDYPIITTTSRLHSKDGSLPTNAASQRFGVKLAIACSALDIHLGFVVGRGMECASYNYRLDTYFWKVLQKCAKWAHFFEANKAGMSILSSPELKPNMVAKNENSNIQKIKHKLAIECEELTLIKYVGVKERELANKRGIFKWSDPNLTSSVMGFKEGGCKARLVDIILDANRSPPEVFDNVKIRSSCQKGDAFIDLETSCLYDVSNYIFMIGLGWNEGEFEQFTVENPNGDEEKRIVDNLFRRLIELDIRRLLHWASHEYVVFKTIDKRHATKFTEHFEFVDMCAQIDALGFCPKGAFNLSLKTVVPAMHAHGMIQTVWSSDCQDGREAMYNAQHAYNIKDKNILDDIGKYNKVDVEVTMEIWRFLASTNRLM